MKRKPKTRKEQRFLKEYINNGGNATKAAMVAYNCSNKNSARSLGAQNLAKLSISETLEYKGISLDFLIDQLKKGFSAKKFTKYGSVPDFAIRSHYLEIALKLYNTANPLPKNAHPSNLNQLLALFD